MLNLFHSRLASTLRIGRGSCKSVAKHVFGHPEQKQHRSFSYRTSWTGRRNQPVFVPILRPTSGSFTALQIKSNPSTNVQCRLYSYGRILRRSEKSVTGVGKAAQQTQLSTPRKVVEAGKTGINFMVILGGFAVAGTLFWAVFKELIFNKFSSQHIFSDALDQIRANEQLKGLIGDSIKGFGETSGRGRRRHLRPVEYIVDGEKYMRFTFYLDGEKSKGTAHVEAKESSLGGFEYRYLFVEVPGQGWPSQTVVLQDNR